MEKENNSVENDFSENEIPNLNSLKPFKSKTNIDINSSSSDDEEEGAEYKVKQISTNK